MRFVLLPSGFKKKEHCVYVHVMYVKSSVRFACAISSVLECTVN